MLELVTADSKGRLNLPLGFGLEWRGFFILSFRGPFILSFRMNARTFIGHKLTRNGVQLGPLRGSRLGFG